LWFRSLFGKPFWKPEHRWEDSKINTATRGVYCRDTNWIEVVQNVVRPKILLMPYVQGISRTLISRDVKLIIVKCVNLKTAGLIFQRCAL
jgi:hypothetical protein